MNSGFTVLLLSVLVALGGLRSRTAPAIVAWAACGAWINLSGSPLAFMSSAWAVVIFTFAARGRIWLAKKLRKFHRGMSIMNLQCVRRCVISFNPISSPPIKAWHRLMTPPVSSAASGLSDSSRKMTTSQPERPSALRSTGSSLDGGSPDARRQTCCPRALVAVIRRN